MNEFVRTRSSYIAQTSLYGYLKTRMGTQFPAYFQDEVFAVSIRTAAAQLFVSCLADLTVYSVATVSTESRLDADGSADLARLCFHDGFGKGLVGVAPIPALTDAASAFERRVLLVDWTSAGNGHAAFAGSTEDIVRFAPVIDEFKQLDREIVSNSIRFRWRDVKEQLRKRIDQDAVCSDWRANGASYGEAP